MIRQMPKNNVIVVLVALVALFAFVTSSMLASPAQAGTENADVKRIGSSEFQNYKLDSDEYKFEIEPDESGSVVINVEPGAQQTLNVNKHGDLEFLTEDGKKEFQLDNLSPIADKHPDAKVGDWQLTADGASVKITSPPKVQAEFKQSTSCDEPSDSKMGPSKPVEAQNAYTSCMLEQGIKAGVAGAIGGCAAGAFAAGVGCVAAILPGATGGYIGGLVISLWDCKDKL